MISLQTEEGIVVRRQFGVAEQLVSYFTTAAANIAADSVISIIEENHGNHGSVITLREVYQGIHFEHILSARMKCKRRLKMTTPTSPVGGTPEHHLNSLRKWPVELHHH